MQSGIVRILHPAVRTSSGVQAGELPTSFGVGALPGSPSNDLDGLQEGIDIGLVVEESDRGSHGARGFSPLQQSIAVISERIGRWLY